MHCGSLVAWQRFAANPSRDWGFSFKRLPLASWARTALLPWLNAPYFALQRTGEQVWFDTSFLRAGRRTCYHFLIRASSMPRHRSAASSVTFIARNLRNLSQSIDIVRSSSGVVFIKSLRLNLILRAVRRFCNIPVSKRNPHQ